MSMTFELQGLDELAEELQKIVKRYPDRAERALVKEGNQFRKHVKKLTPDSGRSHKRKLNKSFKQQISGYGSNMELDVWSNAPHFHLVERGHEKVINGKTVGFVPGRYFFEDASDDYQDTYEKHMEQVFLDLLGGLL